MWGIQVGHFFQTTSEDDIVDARGNSDDCFSEGDSAGSAGILEPDRWFWDESNAASHCGGNVHLTLKQVATDISQVQGVDFARVKSFIY